jgi:hypothetical protein
MDRASGSNAAAPRAPGHLRWDVDRLESHICSLATASAAPGEIVLNFGEQRRRAEQTAEMGPELLRRIALSPLTAKNLAATLRRLLEDHDGGAR